MLEMLGLYCCALSSLDLDTCAMMFSFVLAYLCFLEGNLRVIIQIIKFQDSGFKFSSAYNLFIYGTLSYNIHYNFTRGNLFLLGAITSTLIKKHKNKQKENYHEFCSHQLMYCFTLSS